MHNGCRERRTVARADGEHVDAISARSAAVAPHTAHTAQRLVSSSDSAASRLRQPAAGSMADVRGGSGVVPTWPCGSAPATSSSVATGEVVLDKTTRIDTGGGFELTDQGAAATQTCRNQRLHPGTRPPAHWSPQGLKAPALSASPNTSHLNG